jgi:hypothetical protein
MDKKPFLNRDLWFPFLFFVVILTMATQRNTSFFRLEVSVVVGKLLLLLDVYGYCVIVWPATTTHVSAFLKLFGIWECHVID